MSMSNTKICPTCGSEISEGLYSCSYCFAAQKVPLPETWHDPKQQPAIHYDHGKLRYDLVPPDAMREYVRVLGYGASKYEDRNWERGMSWSRLWASAQRHLWAWADGEDTDPESGHPHLAHAMLNISFLLTYGIREELYEFDDRRKTVCADAGRVAEGEPSKPAAPTEAQADSDGAAATEDQAEDAR